MLGVRLILRAGFYVVFITGFTTRTLAHESDLSRCEIDTTSWTTRCGQRNRRQATRAILRIWRRWWFSTQPVDCFYDQENNPSNDQEVDDVVEKPAVSNYRQTFQLSVGKRYRIL